MPVAAAAPAASAAAAAAEEPAEVRHCYLHVLYIFLTGSCKQEKPKEKTIFNVKLESFDAGAKPKIIREVKALIPNLNLMDVRHLLHLTSTHHSHIIIT